MTEIKLQIGKKGFTEGTIKSLQLAFRKHESVKVEFLKNSNRTKEIVKEVEKKILARLGSKFTANSIGFTIKIRRWRKPRTEITS